AAEGFRRLVKIGVRESQAVQHPGRLRLDHEPAAVLELMLQRPVAMQKRLMFCPRQAGIRQPVLDLLNTALNLQHIYKRGERLVKQTAALHGQPLLWQIADGQVAGSQDLALRRLHLASNDAKERGLPHPVGADQRNAVLLANMPVEIAEQIALAEIMRDID